jgi:GntR family transcriptional repressor for pyruvate dehydrogenase complex
MSDTLAEMANRKRTFRSGRLSEQVVAELEKMISDEFPCPGRLLPKELELGERFGVSRIVIREAMKILEERGLVEVRAGRGTCTVSPSPEKVKQSLLRLFIDQPIPSLEEMERMLELRGILEETVATLAAVRATPEDLAEIESGLNDMAQATSVDEVIRGDLRFHAALARGAHNHYFEMVIDPLTEAFVQQMKLTDPQNVGIELHRNILEAIRTRNQVAARQAVRRLMKQTVADTRRALRTLEETVPQHSRE